MMHENKESYYLYVKGERVPVTEKVYRAYYQAYEQERYRDGCARERERSREALQELGVSVDYRAGAVPSAEASWLATELHGQLADAFAQLPLERSAHLQALLLGETTERALAEALGISRSAVHKRKLRDVAVVRAYLEACGEGQSW